MVHAALMTFVSNFKLINNNNYIATTQRLTPFHVVYTELKYNIGPLAAMKTHGSTN